VAVGGGQVIEGEGGLGSVGQRVDQALGGVLDLLERVEGQLRQVGGNRAGGLEAGGDGLLGGGADVIGQRHRGDNSLADVVLDPQGTDAERGQARGQRRGQADAAAQQRGGADRRGGDVA